MEQLDQIGLAERAVEDQDFRQVAGRGDRRGAAVLLLRAGAPAVGIVVGARDIGVGDRDDILERVVAIEPDRAAVPGTGHEAQIARRARGIILGRLP
ncbi:MAG TPA: hypothetical protein VHZ24_10115, partial [Pirellulales bacterium]|nr:hypothetical protein [Pirellulales bacterium]